MDFMHQLFIYLGHTKFKFKNVQNFNVAETKTNQILD